MVILQSHRTQNMILRCYPNVAICYTSEIYQILSPVLFQQSLYFPLLIHRIFYLLVYCMCMYMDSTNFLTLILSSHPLLIIRVLKQALRASGANATERHIEEASLCTLFLMEAAKTADHEFQLRPRSTKHTTHDATADIHKVSMHLLANGVTTSQTSHTRPPFRDTTEDVSDMAKAHSDTSNRTRHGHQPQ